MRKNYLIIMIIVIYEVFMSFKHYKNLKFKLIYINISNEKYAIQFISFIKFFFILINLKQKLFITIIIYII